MSDQGLRAACPTCGALTRHAIVPLPQVDATSVSNSQDWAKPQAAMKQRLVCTQCERLWEAAIVPVEQLAQLQLAAERPGWNTKAAVRSN
jgi:hypothetical protein